MNFKLALAVSTAIATAGCASPVPVAQNFPLTTQKVARTAHHWDVIAEDVVARTSQALTEKAQLKGRGLHVSSARGTAFDNAFRDFLITRFVADGHKVAVCKQARDGKPGFDAEPPDVDIEYKTQFIRHGELPRHYQPGVLTALAAGVLVLADAAEHDLSHGSVAATVLGATAAAEWGAGHLSQATRSEVIVTTTISEANRFVLRKTDIYYVPDSDAALFIQRMSGQAGCVDGKPAPALAANTDGVKDAAVRQLLDRDIRRFNPDWSRTNSPAYSY